MIAMVNVEHDLHMAEGEGEWSYSKNSRRQVIVILPLFNNETISLCSFVICHFACTCIKFISNDA